MITRDLITLMNTQYLTPFDRDDIYMLATEVDDIVDYLEEASDLLGLYGVAMPTRHAVEQCGIIVGGGAARHRVDNLKGMRVSRTRSWRSGRRGRGRPVLRDALASLFRDDRIDPLS